MNPESSTISFGTSHCSAFAYKVILSHDGVSWWRGGAAILDRQGEVRARAVGIPCDTLAEIYRSWRKWQQEHPPGKRICDGWRLLKDLDTGYWYAQGPKTKVSVARDAGVGGWRWRVRIGNDQQLSKSKSAPLEVICAVLRENVCHVGCLVDNL